MKKKVILIIAVILVAAFVLAGCESYKNKTFDRGDTSQPVESNGGSVVKQGEYIYFINGYADYQSKAQDNWFGNVVKGAIMRIKVSDMGDMTKAETIVPKSVLSGSSNTGFSIYGNYIYYVSPSVKEDRSGTVQTDDLQFLRTDLNGQNTEVILEIEDGKSTQYKYTSKGLVYVKDSKLYFKSTEKKIKKKKEGQLIAEDVTVYMPTNAYYKGATTTDDVVFYTKSSEGTYDYTQTLYAYVPGGESKAIIEKDTFTKGIEDTKSHYKYEYSFSLLASCTESNGDVTLVYTKKYYATTSSSGSTDAGTFMYRFDSSFAFDPQKEVKLTDTALSKVAAIGFEEGVLSTSSTMTLYRGNGARPIVFEDDYGKISFSSSSTDEDIMAVQDGYVFYLVSNRLYCYKLDQSSYVNVLGKTADIDTSFIKPEFLTIDGKINVFYFGKEDNYLYRYTFENYKASSEVEATLFGVKKAEDLEEDED
jgi:hypothetical protein